MRHRKSGVKLNRTTSHRQAMFRNMVTSLLKHDRIKTTETKAKELRRWADQIITLAKRGDLHARRQALSIVREKNVVHKIFEEAAERFGPINGGYTRIVKIGRRAGDAASMTIIELISADAAKPAPKKQAPKQEASQPAAQTEAAEAKTVSETEATDADVSEAAETKADQDGVESEAAVSAATDESPADDVAEKSDAEDAAPKSEGEK